jgi:hypothetical protein
MKVALLVMGLILLISMNEAASQDLSYLKGMPSVESVLKNIRSQKDDSTFFRRAAAFKQLIEIVKAMAREREFRRMTAEENNLIERYQNGRSAVYKQYEQYCLDKNPGLTKQEISGKWGQGWIFQDMDKKLAQEVLQLMEPNTQAYYNESIALREKPTKRQIEIGDAQAKKTGIPVKTKLFNVDPPEVIGKWYCQHPALGDFILQFDNASKGMMDNTPFTYLIQQNAIWIFSNDQTPTLYKINKNQSGQIILAEGDLFQALIFDKTPPGIHYSLKRTKNSKLTGTWIGRDSRFSFDKWGLVTYSGKTQQTTGLLQETEVALKNLPQNTPLRYSLSANFLTIEGEKNERFSILHTPGEKLEIFKENAFNEPYMPYKLAGQILPELTGNWARVAEKPLPGSDSYDKFYDLFADGTYAEYTVHQVSGKLESSEKGIWRFHQDKLLKLNEQGLQEEINLKFNKGISLSNIPEQSTVQFGSSFMMLTKKFKAQVAPALKSNVAKQEKKYTVKKPLFNIENAKAVTKSKVPDCKTCHYLSLCKNMEFVYNEVDLLGINRTIKLTYTHFNTISTGKDVLYGYAVSGEVFDEENGNVYYHCNGEVITQLYEIPTANIDYVGSGWELKKPWKLPTWDNLQLVDNYEKSIDFNTGLFRSITLLPINAPVGTTWLDTAIVDNNPSLIRQTIIGKEDSVELGGKTYKNVFTVQRRVESKTLRGDIVSEQILSYTEKAGLFNIQDISRRHLASDLVKPNRTLVSYKTW